MEHGMHMFDGGRREPFAGALRVECLHTLCAQLREPHRANARDDMQTYALLVAIPGLLHEPRRTDRVEPAGQIVGDRLALLDDGQSRLLIMLRGAELDQHLLPRLRVEAATDPVRERDARLPPAIRAMANQPFAWCASACHRRLLVLCPMPARRRAADARTSPAPRRESGAACPL